MSARPHITCRELIEFLDLYLDGELPANRRAEFDRHLAGCASCVHYIETFKTAIALGRNAWTEPEAPVREEVPEELVSAILAARRSGAREARPPGQRRRPQGPPQPAPAE